MAYKRGGGTVNVELARLQDWAENTDVDLYGEYGQKGIVEEHRERIMREENAKQQDDQSAKKWARYSTFLVAIPVLLKILEVIHVIPK